MKYISWTFLTLFILCFSIAKGQGTNSFAIENSLQIEFLDSINNQLTQWNDTILTDQELIGNWKNVRVKKVESIFIYLCEHPGNYYCIVSDFNLTSDTSAIYQLQLVRSHAKCKRLFKTKNPFEDCTKYVSSLKDRDARIKFELIFNTETVTWTKK